MKTTTKNLNFLAVKIYHEVFFEKLEKWIIKNYGKKCKDYAKGCAVCEAWKLFEVIKKTK